MRAPLRSIRGRWFAFRAGRVIRDVRPEPRELVPYSSIDLSEPFRIAVVGQGEFFAPYVDALTAALNTRGATAHAHENLDSVGDPHAVIVVGPHEHVMRRHRSRLSRSILVGIQTEQLPSSHQQGFQLSSARLADYLRWSPHYDLVVEWSRESADVIRGLGPTVLHLPHGRLDPAAGKEPDDGPDPEETHDLVFLGGLGGPQKRRRRLIQQLARDFHVHPATGQRAWGAAKVRALRESRLVLNLNSDQSLAFPSPRFFETLSLGRPLLSETVADPWPFIPGTDYLESELTGLRDAIATALEDPALRERVARSGLARTFEHPLEGIASRLLGELLALHRSLSAGRA